MTLSGDDKQQILLKKYEQTAGEERLEVLLTLAKSAWYSNPQDNLRWSEEALELARELNNIPGQSRALDSLGIGHHVQGELDRALDCYLQALNLAEQHGFQEGVLRYLNNIALIQVACGDFKSARQYAHRSLKNCQKMEDKSGVARAFNTLGYAHKEDGNLEQARSFFAQALEIYTLLDDSDNRGVLLNNIGECHAEQGQYEQALQYFQDASEHVDQEQFRERLGWYLHNCGKSLLGQKQYETAESFLRQSQDLALEVNRLELIRDNWQVLASLAEELQNFTMALEAYKSYSEVQDDLRSKDSEERIAQLKIEYETEQKEREARIERRERQKVEAINRELLRAKDEIEKLARTDHLTGLPNRRDSLEKLTAEQHRCKRSGNPFSVILCDVDHFKQINDTHGHECGDHILKSLADLMVSSLRKQDLMGRWGGEEFLLIFPDTALIGGQSACETLRLKIENFQFIYKNQNIPVTLTFGVAEFTDGDNPHLCINRADAALYRGKEKGRNCVEIGNYTELPTS